MNNNIAVALALTFCLSGSLALTMPSKQLEKDVPTSDDFVCPGEGYYPHPVNCELYYGCAGFNPILIPCPGQQLFDLRYSGCNWPELTDCGHRERSESYPPTNTLKSYPCLGNLADGLFPNVEDCSSYYRCVHGVSYHYTCANPLVFNEVSKECDYRRNVSCGSRPLR